MIVDSSAILAILLAEPEARQMAACIRLAANPRMATPNWLEVTMNISKIGGDDADRRLDAFFAGSGIQLVAFTAEHAALAREAWRRFGRGRHPARLNFGDCMAYAAAKLEGDTLLFKGDDFTLTDIEPALKDRHA